LYTNKFGNITFHSDVCPHQSASLSKGTLDEFGNICCCYHGFTFKEGKLFNIPSTDPNKYLRSKCFLPVIPTIVNKHYVYGVFNVDSPKEFKIHIPPEDTDSQYTCISGKQEINKYYLTVTENILDNLHLPYTHTFGNPVNPLPYHINFERLTNYSGRTTFIYFPRPGTLSSVLSNKHITRVIVENEYHLPSTTVTRVRVGEYTKTVVTRSLCVEPNKTILYWQIYRNFWRDSFGLGDFVMNFLMKKTLNEDITMLQNVYDDLEYRDNRPLKTPFDVTITNFHKDRKKFQL
jgi:phenylpropionate dioxygenase-like ring-hydroxylating dioxygenase large terminal subunit